jgi:transcriptional regulator with XRE-family HTH domain
MTSLAEFIQTSREKAGYSIFGLSERTSIPVETLEDIESGKDLFLPVTIRQKLARVFKCSPNEIRKYERLESIQYDFEAYLPFWYFMGHSAKLISEDPYNALDSFAREYYKQKAKEHFEKYYQLNK